MPTVKSIKTIALATLSAETINLSSPVQCYKITGNRTIASNISIAPTGTAKEGMVVMFDYLPGTVTANEANYKSGACGLKVFGVDIPYTFIATKMKIYCEYVSSAWHVIMIPSFGTLPVITADAMSSAIWDDATIEYDATTNTVRVKDSGIGHDKMAVNAIEEENIKAGEVGLTRMANIERGSIIVGGGDDAPSYLVAKTDGYILIGDGTDLKSVAMSGDTTITNAGVIAIGARKVLAAMIGLGAVINEHIGAAAAIVFTKMAALTASKIPVLNSSGFIEAGSVDASKLAFIDVTAGTAAASKALVLDASKKINEIDTTLLKIDGTQVTATAAEINSFQAQIDAASSKLVYSIITANTTATAATLKALYLADTTAGGVDLTLPKADTVPANTSVRLLQSGANTAKMKANAADTMYDIDDLSTDQAEIACTGSGKSLTFVCNGNDTWYCVQKDTADPVV